MVSLFNTNSFPYLKLYCLFSEVGYSVSVWLIAVQVNSLELKLALEGFNFLGSAATSLPPPPPFLVGGQVLELEFGSS